MTGERDNVTAEQWIQSVILTGVEALPLAVAYPDRPGDDMVLDQLGGRYTFVVEPDGDFRYYQVLGEDDDIPEGVEVLRNGVPEIRDDEG